MENLQDNRPTHKPRPMIDLLVSIVIPSVILMKFSGDQDLGAARALITALAFPLAWGLFELIRYRKFNFIALLGLVSVLLTGGIGLLELDLKMAGDQGSCCPGCYRHSCTHLDPHEIPVNSFTALQPQDHAGRPDPQCP